MAMKEITKYVVYHKIGGTSAFTVYYASGEATEIKTLNPDEATFLVDLLRNVKPVYYDDTTGMIQTNYEDTGKGARK